MGRTVQCARCAHRWFETVAARPPAAPKAVPDVVIRPSTRPPSLPALIEPKSGTAWGKALVGVVVAVVLLAAGIFVFRDEIAAQLPMQWRTILQLAAS
jgi:hypothetical protein